MKTYFLLGLLTVVNYLAVFAKSDVKINVKGQVVAGSSNDPLEYATVVAYTPDSVLVDGTVTNQQGQFELNLEKGPYLFKFEYLGFVTQFLSIDLKKSFSLGVIELVANQLDLSEVEVRAEKSQMNLMMDKKVFNIGKDALSRGGSANEVLEQLPSVTVSAEGAVSLRGNAGVRILINGRPSALANNNALASISAESIDKIEIITNPSARYEAAGTAGIINIILKKEQQKGYGGTASLTGGYPADHRLQLNLNWRREKYNAFINAGNRYANFFGRSDITRTNELEGVIENLDQDYDQKRNDIAFHAYTGIDYFLGAKSTLTATYSIYDIVNDDIYTTDYLYTNGDDELVEDWQQELDYLEPGTYHQIDLSYTKSFAKEGRKLAVYFRNDLWNEEETEKVKIHESFPRNQSLLQYNTNTLEGSRDHMIQADYESPLGEDGHFEVGIRGETRIISADYFSEQLTDDIFQPIPGFDNKLDYFERIGSAYVQYRYKKDQFGLQIGLRNEYTFVEVELEGNTEEDFRKFYNRLFPSFSLNYELTSKRTVQFSYSRRIRRPQFWQLNPFRGINDPTALFIGNPDMDPAYTDRLELNLVQRWEKFTMNPAIYASTTTDYFEIARDATNENLFGFATGTLLAQPINLDRENQFGVELITNFRPSKALNFSTEFNYYGYQQRGDFEGRNFDFDFASWSGALRMQFDFSKDISFQSRFSYSARRKTVQMLERANHYVAASLSKQWGKKLTLTLSTRSPRWGAVEIFRPSFFLTDRGRWTGWRTQLNLQYRFEKGAKADSRSGRGSIR